MATLLKYVAPGVHVRTISKADFKRAGLVADSVNVDVREEAFVEVSDEVAEWLLSDESGEKSDWKEATAKEAERYGIRTAPDVPETPDAPEEPTPEKKTKADSRPGGGSGKAGDPVTVGDSNTGSSS